MAKNTERGLGTDEDGDAVPLDSDDSQESAQVAADSPADDGAEVVSADGVEAVPAPDETDTDGGNA